MLNFIEFPRVPILDNLSKRMLSDTACYTIASIINKLMGFGLMFFLTARASAEAIGRFDLLIQLSSLAIIFCNLELFQAATRFVSKKRSHLHLKRLISTILLLTSLSTTLIFFLIYITLKPIIEFTGVTIVNFNDLIVFLIGFWFLSHYQVLLSFLKALFYIKSFVFVSILSISTQTVVSITLILFKFDVLTSLIYGFLISNIFGFAATLPFIRKFLIFEINLRLAKRLLNFVFPLIPFAFLELLRTRIEYLSIPIILDVAHLGSYSIFMRIASIATLFSISLNSAVLQRIISTNNQKNSNNSLIYLWKIYILVFIIFGVFINNSITPRLSFYLEPDMLLVAKGTPIILLNSFFISLYTFTPSPILKQKTKLLPFFGLISIIISVFFSFLLGFNFGIVGLLTGQLFGTLAFIIPLLIINKKLLNIAYDLPILLTAVALVVFSSNHFFIGFSVMGELVTYMVVSATIFIILRMKNA